MKSPDPRRGSILVYTLLSLVVLSMVMSVVYDRLISVMRSSRNWLWKEKALVSAESGAAATEGRLLANPAWSAGENNAPEWQFKMDDAEIQVRTERFRPPDVVWIFSTGRYKKEQRDLVRPVIVRDPTLFAVMARNELRMGLGSIVEGSVYGDDVEIAEGGEVLGSIISIGAIRIARRPPETILFDSATTPPLVPDLKTDRIAKTWTRQWQADPKKDTASRGGLVFHRGDLALENFSGSNLSLRVDGNLTLNGKVDLRFDPPADTPILVVGKDLTGTLTGSKIRGVIYVTGKVSLKGEGLIVGTLIAEDIELGQGVVIKSFDGAGGLRPPPGFWPRQVRRIRN